MKQHELLYRAGTLGLEHLGLHNSAPTWFCRCRGWTFPARPMPRRRTGVNKAEAISAWHAHVRSEKKAGSTAS